MAREKLSNGIDEINGATSPGHIHRVKRFRDARGRIIGVGVQETFDVVHPRNYNLKPAKGAEKANQEFFRQASVLMDKILGDPQGYEYWQKRFEAQLPCTPNSKPDPFASYDPKTKTRRRYMRFDAFVRAVVRNILKQQKT